MPLGPVFRFTTTLGALATIRPFQDQSWIYRVLPFAAVIWLSLEADATGVVATFQAGSDAQLGPDSPVQSGATAGVFQNDDNFFDRYLGAAGDEIMLTIRETANVATTDVNIVARLQPA